MLHEIWKGYHWASCSKAISPSYDYGEQAERFKQNISENEQEETQKEFQELSEYRKCCCRQNLTLSEHGLYCSCAARDNLTIPLTTATIGDVCSSNGSGSQSPEIRIFYGATLLF